MYPVTSRGRVGCVCGFYFDIDIYIYIGTGSVGSICGRAGGR